MHVPLYIPLSVSPILWYDFTLYYQVPYNHFTENTSKVNGNKPSDQLYDMQVFLAPNLVWADDVFIIIGSRIWLSQMLSGFFLYWDSRLQHLSRDCNINS